eukprot:SAG31_NODE_2168_length_6266_cov_11.946976_4_plen_87_part_00
MLCGTPVQRADNGRATLMCCILVAGDAECALEFLPYWRDCLTTRSLADETMRQFTVLYTACTVSPPPAHRAILKLISLSDAKPRLH